VPAQDTAARCERLFQDLDAAVERAGVRDGGAVRIDGFPYLRASRFLASYRDERLDRRQALGWIERMRQLDRQARVYELARLPRQQRDDPGIGLPNAEALAGDLERCAEALVLRDLSDPASMAALRDAVEVPDEYQSWKRVLGLYPLTALPFLQGVAAYHADREAVFATPLADLPVDGRLVRYGPPAAPSLAGEGIGAMLAGARRNPLGIPLPSPSELARLFTAFAPVLEIDQVDRNDRIGVPMLSRQGEPAVDTSAPVVFARAAHTRLAGQALLQLVYSVWFPARPRTGVIDLLAGRLDGITWRVTLDARGQPILFDSIHNCGCYHMAFPTDGLHPRKVGQGLTEPLLVPATLGPWRHGRRVVLRIAAGTHYIQNVRYDTAVEVGVQTDYAFAPDDDLRSLEREDGSRYSLFRHDGIVPGTQRGERFLFWPMGVPDPGAMRQWGRHATAFVGRRHFDDPDLIERYFELP
jgi:hypothetical protein